MNGRRARASLGRGASAGFTYLIALVLVVVMGFALAAVTQVWATASQRAREAELLFVGDQFYQAIEAYRVTNGNVGDGFPKDLESLLLDPNRPDVKRYLRRIYRDPMTDSIDWGFVRSPAGNIMGVYSLSQKKPYKMSGFDARYAQFAEAESYEGWKFAVAALAPGKAVDGGAATGDGTGLTPVISPDAPPQAVSGTPQRPDRCAGLQRSDLSTCSGVGRRFGPGAESECFSSAQARLSVCQRADGTRLPPLRSNF